MLSDTSTKISKIGNIVKGHKKEGLHPLIAFKLIKSRLKDEIVKKYGEKVKFTEDLNEFCIKRAREIVDKGKDNPSEDDIKRYLINLRISSVE